MLPTAQHCYLIAAFQPYSSKLAKDRGSGGETLMRVSLNSDCPDSQALEYLAEPGHVIN